MALVYNLPNYRWGGMLSIWGQKQVGHQGACYANLTYAPKNYITEIGKGAPPVQKWLLRYNGLPLDDAQWWLSFLLQHIFPEELKEKLTITRAKSKTGWPNKWANERNILAILEDWDYDAGLPPQLNDRLAAAYGGSTPWLQLELDQSLSARTMFATGVFLRYASEHAPAIIATKALMEMKIPGIGPDQALVLGHCLGGARGHAVSNFGYLPKGGIRKALETYSWRERFLRLMDMDKSFYIHPEKQGDVDRAFHLPWTDANGNSRYVEICCEPGGQGIVEYNGIQIQTNVKKGDVPHIMGEWLVPEVPAVAPAKKKVARKRHPKVQPNIKGFNAYVDFV